MGCKPEAYAVVTREQMRRPVRLRAPQHTGEWVWIEPLATFLRRKIWVRPDNYRPAEPNRAGWVG